MFEFITNLTNYGPKSFKGKSVKEILGMTSSKVPDDFFTDAYTQAHMQEFIDADLSVEQENAIDLLSDLKAKEAVIIPKCYTKREKRMMAQAQQDQAQQSKDQAPQPKAEAPQPKQAEGQAQGQGQAEGQAQAEEEQMQAEQGQADRGGQKGGRRRKGTKKGRKSRKSRKGRSKKSKKGKKSKRVRFSV